MSGSGKALRPGEAIEDWYVGVPRSIRGTVISGLALSVVIFGGFGTWASTAPLAAAVVSHGTFVATGKNKQVQHFEGGIIRSILVEEGDRVEKGQPLVLLDETAARTNVRRLLLRLASYRARSIRLQAMISGASTLDFGAIEVDEADRREADRVFEGQRNVFAAARRSLEGQVAVLGRNQESLRRRMEGSQAQYQAVERQGALIRQELAAKTILFNQGLYRRSDLFTVERAAAEAEGALGRIAGELGDMRSQIARLDGQIAQARQEVQQNATQELQGIEADMDDMREQLLAAQSVLGRTEVRAPVSGTLVKLNYHTAGGVVESGRQIAEILPRDEKLVIETLINPTDINGVRQGQPAGVRLTSFNQRTTPQMRGLVTYVSADTVPDPRPGRMGDVYVVRVTLPEHEVERVPGLRVGPGMPADIFVETSHRTFLNYLVKPVQDSMNRAFLER